MKKETLAHARDEQAASDKLPFELPRVERHDYLEELTKGGFRFAGTPTMS